MLASYTWFLLRSTRLYIIGKFIVKSRRWFQRAALNFGAGEKAFIYHYLHLERKALIEHKNKRKYVISKTTEFF